MRRPSAPIVLSWGKAEKGKGPHLLSNLGVLGSAPHAYADTLSPPRALVPPSHLHMYIISRTLRGGR